ncbi:MAG TPA: hypothetical protein VMB25_24490 [Bryobacteraceae bacterium]|nr:hypothetical protein [Bryobacteraceae bacterium]
MKHRDDTDFEIWLRDRTRSLPEPEVSPDFLAAQRRSIYQRIGEPRRHAALRWAFSAAMLLLLVAGFAFQRVQVQKPAATISDEQLFSDLANMEQRTEPKAIQPIHGLFEE